MSRKKVYASDRQRERQYRILECAREMLNEHGYAKFSMRELAQRARVSRSTLYNLFGSRDQLAYAAVEKSQEEIAALIAEARPEEGVDTLVTAIRISSEEMLAYPQYTQVMAKALMNASPDDAMVEVLFGPHRLPAADQIEIAQEKGEIDRNVDPVLLAQHLNGQNWGVILNWLMGRFSDDQFPTEIMRSRIAGLLAVARGPTATWLQEELRKLDEKTAPPRSVTA